MNRKLLALNLALLAAVVYTGMRIRDWRRATEARQAAVLSRRVPAAPAPAFLPAQSVPPVLPSGYAEIAQKMLFDKSRNSTVVIETPPPPPPKPMPPLPVYHGQMKLPGAELLVFLSEAGHGAHRSVHVGDAIGEFKLLEANRESLTFDWDGKKITRSLKELAAAIGSPVAQAAPAAKPAAPLPPAPKPVAGPGADLGGFRACVANDGYAGGAVVDGYQKVMISNPFAPNSACQWQPVGR